MAQNLFLYLIPLLFSLGQLGRISIFNQQINFYLYEVFLILHLFRLILIYKLKPIKLMSKKIFFLPILMFWIILSFSLSAFDYSLYTNFIAFLYMTRLFIYIFWSAYFIFHLNIHKSLSKGIKRISRIMLIIVLTLSFIQYFLYPDLNNLKYLGWDMHYNRLFGLFFDTSITGAVIGILILLQIYKFNDTRDKILSVSLLLISILAGILTFSRNFYISFLLSFFAYGVLFKKWKLFLVFIITFLILLTAAPKNFGPGVGLLRIFTIQSRATEYQRAIEIWKESPIFGIGYNRLREVKEQTGQIIKTPNYILHSAASYSSSFAIILTTSGLVGLALFVLALIQIGMRNRNYIVFLVFAGLMSFGDNVLLHPFTLFILSWSFANINLSDRQPS